MKTHVSGLTLPSFATVLHPVCVRFPVLLPAWRCAAAATPLEVVNSVLVTRTKYDVCREASEGICDCDIVIEIVLLLGRSFCCMFEQGRRPDTPWRRGYNKAMRARRLSEWRRPRALCVASLKYPREAAQGERSTQGESAVKQRGPGLQLCGLQVGANFSPGLCCLCSCGRAPAPRGRTVAKRAC